MIFVSSLAVAHFLFLLFLSETETFINTQQLYIMYITTQQQHVQRYNPV